MARSGSRNGVGLEHVATIRPRSIGFLLAIMHMELNCWPWVGNMQAILGWSRRLSVGVLSP